MEALLVLLALVLLVAPIVALTVAFSVRQSLRAINARLLDLEQVVASLPKSAPTRRSAPTEPVPATEVSSPASAATVGAGVPPRVSPPGPTGADTDWRQWESWLGGTWLNRVGAIILVLGLGFFLKYAFDQRWIRPAGRVALGLLTGLGLLILGERLQRATYRVPAQGVVAVGIATLYLSVYAAYGFYQLIAQLPAFAFMVLVTATGLALAIHHEARAVAVLATLGGFLTPILLAADRDAAIALFTYLAVLDAGVLASAYWRRWPELAGLSFAFTQLLYWGWFQRWYHQTGAEPQRAVALVGATVFLVLFVLVAPVEAAGRRFVLTLDLAAHPTTILTLAAPTAFFITARAVLYSELRTWLGLVCLVLSAFYAVLAWWASGLRREAAPLALLHWAIALAFLTLTFPIQFTEHGTAIAWSVEGSAIVWGGFRLRERVLRFAGLAVLALAAMRWLSLMLETAPHRGVFVADHPGMLASVFFVLAAALTTHVYHYYERTGMVVDHERYARPILALAATLAAALFVTREIEQHRALALDRGAESVLITMVWLAAAQIVLALAPGDSTRTLLGTSLLLLALVGLKTAVVDAERWLGTAVHSLPVLNLRFAAGLAVTASYWILGRMIGVLPIPAERNQQARAIAAAATGLFLLWHLSAEIVLMPLDGMPPGEMTMTRHMGLSILWTLYAFVAMTGGILWRQPALRFGAIGLFGLTVGKVFLVDLSQLDAGYRILSFVILGGLLILASFLYTKYSRRILGEAP